MLNTVVDTDKVPKRLLELNLNLTDLLEVIHMTLYARNTITDFDVPGSRGDAIYRKGNLFLREKFVGHGGWELATDNHLAGIIHPELGIRILVQNVVKACDEFVIPQPISEKGTSSTYIAEGNLKEYQCTHLSFDFYNNAEAIEQVKKANGLDEQTVKLYYLMIDAQNNVELSRPIIVNGKFKDCIERLFIYKANTDFDVTHPQTDDSNQDVDDCLDFHITPKTQ
ncbi:MAG: hypothetical protein QJT80_06800 [Candidatus Thiocaldithrix dubininis]|uniref:Uncharacterized protein n=1 Tax=Candidatus Thiocaldithrix dubininis TaxID=3080823 RepID=A0AA95HA21_9GAMM|nr:MAG: hypothetical protein QJT80_06800 [Candidatus Thiocaldithrix dubininis]